MIQSNEKKYSLGIILSAFLLQFIWLFAIGWTGATSDWLKLAIIGVFCLISTGFVLLLPSNWILKLHQSISQPGKIMKIILILLLAGVIVSGIIYIANQRIWSDEMENYYTARKLTDNGFEAFLEKYKTDNYFANHPPLMPILYGGMMEVFGPNLSSMRILGFFFCLGTLWLVFAIGKNFYDFPTGLVSSVLLFTFPLILRLGTAGMLDIPVVFFFLLSIWLALLLKKNPSFWIAIGLGLTMTLASLVRYTGLLVVPVILLIPLLDKSYRKVLLQIGLALVVFGVLFFSWVYTAHQMGLTVPIISKYFTIGLVSTNAQSEVLSPPSVSFSPNWMFNPQDGLGWLLNSLFTRLPSAIGVYHFPLILIAAISVFKTRKPVEFILLGWILIISISVFLTLPDHRYFMPAFPAMAILMAGWLKNYPELEIRYSILSILFLLGTLVLLIDWQRQAELFIR